MILWIVCALVSVWSICLHTKIGEIPRSHLYVCLNEALCLLVIDLVSLILDPDGIFTCVLAIYLIVIGPVYALCRG